MNAVVTAVAPTAILVLGMHRSGTSATTRVLNLLGVELGPSLLAPQPDNQKGFWEHYDAVQIHERLLLELGRDWHDLRELPRGWLEHPASLRAIEEIVGLIRRDFSGVQLWAVKDPRMCRLAPLWIQALKQLGIRAAALIVARDPREVAASLHARDGWSYAHSWLMWSQHLLESISATEHISRAMLNYDDLMKDWATNVTRIGDELGITWPRGIGEARSEVDAFLSHADRHHQVGEETVVELEEHAPPQWVMRLMDVCSDVAAGRSSWGSIAALNKDYLAHAELFAGHIAELTRDQKALKLIAVERMEVIEQIQRDIAEHSAHLKSTMAAMDTRSGELRELMQQYEGLQQRHEDLQQRYEDLSAQHSQLERASEAQSVEQMRLESSIAELQRTKLQVEEQLIHMRTVTRSRLWLLRRIAQMTFRRSALSDESLD